MLQITEKGKNSLKRNGGILKIRRSLISGNYDYSRFDTWEQIYNQWAEDKGGWNILTKSKRYNGKFFTEKESRIILMHEFKKESFETSINECLENNDFWGIGVEFGYLSKSPEK